MRAWPAQTSGARAVRTRLLAGPRSLSGPGLVSSSRSRSTRARTVNGRRHAAQVPEPASTSSTWLVHDFPAGAQFPPGAGGLRARASGRARYARARVQTQPPRPPAYRRRRRVGRTRSAKNALAQSFRGSPTVSARSRACAASSPTASAARARPTDMSARTVRTRTSMARDRSASSWTKASRCQPSAQRPCQNRHRASASVTSSIVFAVRAHRRWVHRLEEALGVVDRRPRSTSVPARTTAISWRS